jgi:putative addiction module killer protein
VWALGSTKIKIDFGPGYRVYFGKDGGRIVILLGGSAKKRQGAAIAAAQAAWAEYKRRKGGME